MAGRVKYSQLHIWRQASIHTCMHVNAHARTHARTHAHTHTHTHTHTHRNSDTASSLIPFIYIISQSKGRNIHVVQNYRSFYLLLLSSEPDVKAEYCSWLLPSHSSWWLNSKGTQPRLWASVSGQRQAGAGKLGVAWICGRTELYCPHLNWFLPNVAIWNFTHLGHNISIIILPVFR